MKALLAGLEWLDRISSAIGILIVGGVFGAALATAICVAAGVTFDFDDSRSIWILISSIVVTTIVYALAYHWMGRLLASLVNAVSERRRKPLSGDSAG